MHNLDQKEITKLIKEKSIDLGFFGIAVAKAMHMDDEASKLEAWLKSGSHGNMTYLEDHFDKRVDPTKLVHGSKSVISLMYNYYTDAKQEDESAPKISMYAYGKDYHRVVKKKLVKLLKWMRREFGDFAGRCFVDSAPVLERDWAKRSGLGWIGKNALLINPKKGSHFFLAEIICDLDLDYGQPMSDHCGSCTRCIDACPTDAISENGYLVDGSKCISYLTIELKDEIPTVFSDQMENWMFGCDICQDVCPWNRFSQPHKEEKFMPREELLKMSKRDWEEITEETFDVIFHGSPVKRTQYDGLKRNINFLLKKVD